MASIGAADCHFLPTEWLHLLKTFENGLKLVFGIALRQGPKARNIPTHGSAMGIGSAMAEVKGGSQGLKARHIPTHGKAMG
jgi:hypothetical protein